MGAFRFNVAPDDSPLYIVRRDISAGLNQRQGENVIQENQATVLENVSLDVAGERSLRSGSTILACLATTVGQGIFGFQPDSGVNKLIVNSGSSIQWYDGSSFSSIACLATTVDLSLPSTMTSALELDLGDVVIYSNGTNNALRLDPVVPAWQDLGSTYQSPPKTRSLTYYRNRLWALNDNKLFYSGAIPADYSTTFNATTSYYNIPVGTERGLAGTRDFGLLIFGSDNVYQLNPSVTPDPTADKPELVVSYGCANGNTIKQVGDDFFYLAYDGVRALRRTAQDKLQVGQSFPLSYLIKDEFDIVSWSSIDKADGVYFENKYIITLPTAGSTTNNKMWVYYPVLNAWVVFSGINIGRFATCRFSGEERLYGIDSNNGNVYRLFYGTSDNGSAISYTEEGRSEDFGQPLVYKYGGEFKLKIKGKASAVNVTASTDGSGYQSLNGSAINLPTGGLDFPFDFPFSFGEFETSGVWHLDSLGKFKTIKFKIYSGTLNGVLTIVESLATTFKDEYQPEE